MLQFMYRLKKWLVLHVFAKKYRGNALLSDRWVQRENDRKRNRRARMPDGLRGRTIRV